MKRIELEEELGLARGDLRNAETQLHDARLWGTAEELSNAEANTNYHGNRVSILFDDVARTTDELSRRKLGGRSLREQELNSGSVGVIF